MKNVENGYNSIEGLTMLPQDPSCNTRFAKVKFRLKTTQLETIFNSCPGDKKRRLVVQGSIIQGQLLRGQKPGSEYPGRNFMGDICPEGSYPEGNCHRTNIT